MLISQCCVGERLKRREKHIATLKWRKKNERNKCFRINLVAVVATMLPSLVSNKEMRISLRVNYVRARFGKHNANARSDGDGNVFVLNSTNITTFFVCVFFSFVSPATHYLVWLMVVVLCFFYLCGRPRGSFNKSINPNDEIRAHNGAGKKLFVFICSSHSFVTSRREKLFNSLIFHFIRVVLARCLVSGSKTFSSIMRAVVCLRSAAARFAAYGLLT